MGSREFPADAEIMRPVKLRAIAMSANEPMSWNIGIGMDRLDPKGYTANVKLNLRILGLLYSSIVQLQCFRPLPNVMRASRDEQ